MNVPSGPLRPLTPPQLSRHALSAGLRAAPLQDPEAGGTALITALVGTLLLSVLLAGTMTMTLQGRRSADDVSRVSVTRGVADSALARGQLQLRQNSAMIGQLAMDNSTSSTQLLTLISGLCDRNVSYPRIDTLLAGGQEMCTVPPITASSADSRVAMFSEYTALPAGKTQAQWRSYWKNALAGAAGDLVGGPLTTTTDRGSSSTTVTGGLRPDKVWIYPGGVVRVHLQTTPVVVASALSEAGGQASARTVSEGVPQRLHVEFSQPSFSQYQYFVNLRTLPTGGRLVFWDSDVFRGKVHANGRYGSTAPLFYAGARGGGPRFLGRYTSEAAFEWSASSPYKNVPRSTIFPAGATFGAAKIDLPTSTSNQRLAAAGLDPGAPCLALTSPTSDRIQNCLISVYGDRVRTQSTGVYYGTGNASVSNTGPGFASGKGGIYVKGTVSNLKLSKNGNWQRIEIKQGTLTTLFEQQDATTWKVFENGVLKKTMSNSTFNGMVFVEGEIGDQLTKGANGLVGDGTAGADIASGTQMTVAASSNVYLKDSVTYTDAPTAPGATNVLGVLSEAGNIKVNGPLNRSINIDGSLMAIGAGKGFGVVGYNTTTFGSPLPKIVLRGGIIENQSQGVGTTTGEGYGRDFDWDTRFSDPTFMPPFFPLQNSFDASSCFYPSPEPGSLQSAFDGCADPTQNVPDRIASVGSYRVGN